MGETMDVAKDKLKEIYILMKRCRMFEERAVEEYRRGRIPGFVHTSIGQEAVPSAICALLEPTDYVFATHRGHSEIIAKGARFDRMMAELFARPSGYCQGKGGSMHIIAPECNVLGCSAIVGAGIPIACGVGLACKLKKSSRVTVCFFGDGATFTGAFHEGIGIAASFDLPVIFVCENNQYAISTHWRDHLKLPNIAARTAGYGIHGISVDGMNPEEIAEVAADVINDVRNGKGPFLIEAQTYRYYGHGQYDTGEKYRTEEEVESYKQRDPIQRLYSKLVEMAVINDRENRDLEVTIKDELDKSVEIALNEPHPPHDAAFSDVFCGITE